MAMSAEEICSEIETLYGRTDVDRATTKGYLEVIQDKVQMYLDTLEDVNSDDAGAFDPEEDNEDDLEDED